MLIDMPRNPQVVAEGVETEDQLEQVTMLGCKYVQGYHFARPVGAKTTQALMKERDDLQRAFAVLAGIGVGFRRFGFAGGRGRGDRASRVCVRFMGVAGLVSIGAFVIYPRGAVNIKSNPRRLRRASNGE